MTLTAAEMDIAVRVASGMTNEELAHDLGVSAAIVSNGLSGIYKKMDSGIGNNRVLLTLWVLTRQ